MTLQPDLFDRPHVHSICQARAERDHGMRVSVEHADTVAPGWPDLAYSFLELFARRNRQFTSFDLRTAFKAAQMEPAPSDKAFGAIFTKAARNGLIRKIGFAPHPERHASPTVLWWSMVYPEAT